MPKRFTDTEKFNGKFIRKLPASYKLLWIYIWDKCDHAGIWVVDIEVSAIVLGDNTISEKEALSHFEGYIQVVENGDKWYIPAFINFQYGELNPANKVHNSVIKILTSLNLLGAYKPLTSPLQGAKEKEKDQLKEKEKADKEDENFSKFNAWIKENAPNVGKMKEPFTHAQFLNLKQDFSNGQISELLEKMHNYKNLTKNISANLTFRNWAKKNFPIDTEPVKKEVVI